MSMATSRTALAQDGAAQPCSCAGDLALGRQARVVAPREVLAHDGNEDVGELRTHGRLLTGGEGGHHALQRLHHRRAVHRGQDQVARLAQRPASGAWSRARASRPRPARRCPAHGVRRPLLEEGVSHPHLALPMKACSGRSSNSIGCSIVTTCRARVWLTSWTSAASVDDLPQPVGPLADDQAVPLLGQLAQSAGCRLSGAGRHPRWGAAARPGPRRRRCGV